MKKFKVRFNLGKGKNFMKFQVINNEKGSFKYYDPNTHTLILQGCLLHNQVGTAKKIFEGANKSVCAWIYCDSIIIIKDSKMKKTSLKISYNPKKAPNWLSFDGQNIDKKKFNMLYTVGNSFFIANKGAQLELNF